MSTRATVLALARIEGRRLARHPFVLAGAVIPLVVCLQILASDDTETDYAWTLLVPFMSVAAGVLVAVNLAALRARRDGAEELYRSLPTPITARTAAHLVSLAWAVAVAALLVAIAVLILLSKGTPLPATAHAVTTPALVVVCGALGLALARWLPHPAVATVGVVAVFALANGGGVLGGSARGLVVVGFLGLAALCGALALLRDRAQLA